MYFYLFEIMTLLLLLLILLLLLLLLLLIEAIYIYSSPFSITEMCHHAPGQTSCLSSNENRSCYRKKW